MKVPKGIVINDTETGQGRHAVPGDNVTFVYECRLNRGELVSDSTEHGPIPYRLGVRDCAVGVEYGLMGMRVGGRRKIRVPPHLTYIERQTDNRITPTSVLTYQLRLLSIDDPPWDAGMKERLDITGIAIAPNGHSE